MMINKEPLYLQINKELQRKIETEGYNQGDKFLTERAICDLFEVSRATANKALSSLVSQNILEFKKGIGTFIQSIPLRQNRSLLFSNPVAASEIIRNEVTDCKKLSPRIQLFLDPAIQKEIHFTKTLFTIDGRVLAIEERYTMEEYHPEENKDIIEIRSLSEESARILQSEPGESGFVITTICNNQDHDPAAIVKTTYKPGSIRIIHKNHCEIQFII